ncbi:MAG TPA: DnaB-like helicase C-terminal domain-containing protein, partial [Candidatus Obscuribacterales bacterium]
MAEKTILSAMIQEPDRFVRMALGDGLESAMFHRHSLVFDQWVEYVKSSDVVEFAHFVQQMNIDGHLDRMGGASALADIYTYAPSPGATWTQSIAQLREVYARRLAVMSSYKLGEAEDSDEAIQSATDALEKIKAAVTGPKRSKSGAEAVKSFVQRQEEWMKSGEMPGLSTGIECIDLISGGMRDGEFWVVGGKPSQGKSVVMLQIAGNVLELQKPVAIFTLEMMANQCVGRLVSYLSKMDYTKITQPRKMLQGDMPKMERATTLLSTSRLWIDDSANQTADTIANEAIRLRD